jgi:NADPH2:quinone reductase
MRAWRVKRFAEPADALVLDEDVAPFEPGPGEVKVRVAAAGLGLPDVFMCRNAYPLTPPLPFVPGQEAAGTIVAVGEGVDPAAVGRRVFGTTQFQAGRGGLAEECLMVGAAVVDVPDGMSAEEAAGFYIPFWTAWVGLVRRAALSAADTVLVLGASGSSGSAAVQLAKAIGARVIAVAGGEEKSAFCRALGADAVIDHRREDVTAAAREWTGGRGASVVYDPVGGAAGRAAFQATAFEGRYVVIGFASGEWAPIHVSETLFPNISLLGALPNGFPPEVFQQARQELTAHWRAGRLRQLGNQIFDFADGRRAVEHIAKGHVAGKVVVRVGKGERS